MWGKLDQQLFSQTVRLGFHLKGGVDFYERVKGGQIKLSDLPPVTWLNSVFHVLPVKNKITKVFMYFLLSNVQKLRLFNLVWLIENSLKLFGCLRAEGDNRVRGERSLDFWRQSVDGNALLLSDIHADGRQLSPWWQTEEKWLRQKQDSFKHWLWYIHYVFKKQWSRGKKMESLRIISNALLQHLWLL